MVGTPPPATVARTSDNNLNLYATPFQEAAAARIEATFRGYLVVQARKALCALRGLVKLRLIEATGEEAGRPRPTLAGPPHGAAGVLASCACSRTKTTPPARRSLVAEHPSAAAPRKPAALVT
ncbi:hypothetical protein ZWY2020_015393 [Hordeum vulgare]|nr:hypothetical protein ZWY2020_015393 [Hordeum vulgare]